jgi:uncharacterized membrane protein
MSARVGWAVARVTRVVTILAVAIQATLLGLEMASGAVGATVRAQGAILTATVVLALLAFRSAARIQPADPLLRLRRSGGLRLAAVRVPLTGGRR